MGSTCNQAIGSYMPFRIKRRIGVWDFKGEEGYSHEDGKTRVW